MVLAKPFILKRFFVGVAIFGLIFSGQVQFCYPQSANILSANHLLLPSQPFDGVVLKGIKVHADNPLLFDFILDIGDTNLSEQALKEEVGQLVRYFLTALTVPEENFWVNLSPYEKERILPDILSTTDLGNGLLGQDKTLKQLAASLTYPETEAGEKYWDEINNPNRSLSEPRPSTNPRTLSGSLVSIHPARGGTLNERIVSKGTMISQGAARIETTQSFNKVWIMPKGAKIFVDKDKALIKESRLEVMTGEDYFAMNSSLRGSVATKQSQSKITTPHDNSARNGTTAAFRQHILPLIEKEVNYGKHFCQLRRIYNAMLLAAWFKLYLKETIVAKLYADKSKLSGVNTSDPRLKDKIYNQYLEAFRQGAYNYAKSERVETRCIASAYKITKRNYFSGGFDGARKGRRPTDIVTHGADASLTAAECIRPGKTKEADVRLVPDSNLPKHLSDYHGSSNSVVHLAIEDARQMIIAGKAHEARKFLEELESDLIDAKTGGETYQRVMDKWQGKYHHHVDLLISDIGSALADIDAILIDIPIPRGKKGGVLNSADQKYESDLAVNLGKAISKINLSLPAAKRLSLKDAAEYASTVARTLMRYDPDKLDSLAQRGLLPYNILEAVQERRIFDTDELARRVIALINKYKDKDIPRGRRALLLVNFFTVEEIENLSKAYPLWPMNDVTIACIGNPVNPRKFLSSAQEEYEAISGDKDFGELPDSVIKEACISHSKDPRKFLHDVLADVDEISNETEFKNIPKWATLMVRVDRKDARDFLRKVLKRYADIMRVKKFSTLPKSVLLNACLRYPAQTRHFLRKGIELHDVIIRESKFSSVSDNLVWDGCINHPASTRDFLLKVMKALRQICSEKEFAKVPRSLVMYSCAHHYGKDPRIWLRRWLRGEVKICNYFFSAAADSGLEDVPAEVGGVDMKNYSSKLKVEGKIALNAGAKVDIDPATFTGFNFKIISIESADSASLSLCS